MSKSLMGNKWLVIFFCCLGAGLVACFSRSKKPPVASVLTQYQQDVDKLENEVHHLVELISNSAAEVQIQQQFIRARTAYKQTEWLTEYYFPFTAKQINGPAQTDVDAEEKNLVVLPEGFQVLESLLFPVYHTREKQEVVHQANILHSNIGRLKNVAALLHTTDAHIFDAWRLELFRIVVLGISGFDSPVAHNSIPEAAASIRAIKAYYSFYQDDVEDNNKWLAHQLQLLFEKADSVLSGAHDFDSFNRMALITQCLNPLSESLLQAQQALHIAVFKEPRLLRADAPTLFAANIFNPDFYTSNTDAYSSDKKVALGKKLFYDGILSGNGKRSCATCHQPQKAFTDGLATSLAIDGKNVHRNAPTLINAALQPALFYDERVNFLEDQAKEVITNPEEMHGSLAEAVQRLKKHAGYQKLFAEAYHTPVSEWPISNAIASYVRSLIALNAPFDQYMRGNPTAMNPLQIDGFNLFSGKAKCATCHFMPLFNGAHVPLFDKIEAEVLGVPANTDTAHAVLDGDEGKYGLYKIALHQHAFKTPSLRNVALTAPYMHNGVYKTLEEVIDFYNRGGGAGLNLQLANQTLPAERLHLTAYEKKALIAFMHTLTDTSGTNR